MVANWTGIAAYIFFTLAFAFYMWIRITKTLDLGPYLACVLNFPLYSPSLNRLFGAPYAVDLIPHLTSALPLTEQLRMNAHR